LYCPQCGADYRPGFTLCSDCLVPLVDRSSEASAPAAPVPAVTAPSAEALRRHLELVTVFKTGDPGLIAVVKSILQSAEIPFTTKGEGIQDLTGVGRLGSGYNPAFGPVEVQVSSADVTDTSVLLDDLEPGGR
jgi:hypothetical protein